VTRYTAQKFKWISRTLVGVVTVFPLLSASIAYGSPASGPYGSDDLSGAFSGISDFIDTVGDLASDAEDIYDGFEPDDPSDTPADATLGTLCLSNEVCKTCVGDSAVLANNAFKVLVNNERLLARTLRKAKMYETVADGAASQHAAAKAAYAIQQATQIEPAKRKFFKNIGKAQDKALNLLDQKLRHIGECELEHMGTATFLALGEHTHQLAKIRFKISIPED